MPRTAIDPEIRKRAKALRRDATPYERHLWSRLRDLNKQIESHFRRQTPIGRYIVDFVCLKGRLVVELDGSQHVGSCTDPVRDAWLERQGFRVMRFWNTEVSENLEGVVEAIRMALEEQRLRRPPPLTPPHEGDGNPVSSHCQMASQPGTMVSPPPCGEG